MGINKQIQSLRILKIEIKIKTIVAIKKIKIQVTLFYYFHRRDLDNQLNNKSNKQNKQIQEDKRYYEFIVEQANKQKLKQERQKLQKIQKRKIIQNQNAYLLQLTKNSRLSNLNNETCSFQIGTKSQIQHKLKSQLMKKNVLDTLDQQLRIKQLQKLKQKQSQLNQFKHNLQYQQLHNQNRYNKNKYFQQNQQVYQYYNQLQRQKRLKDLQLQHKFINQAAQKKKFQDDQKTRFQQYKKTMIKQQVKQTLDRQVKQHTLKKIQQQRINPQQYSYGIIGNVFRQRHPTYDKNKYKEQLQIQAQIQRQKKKMENFMSDQEYKLNMNQLNKVVNGQYAYSNYLDRSLGTIGDSKQLRLADIKDSIADKDADMVKQRLQNLRKRNRSQIVQRNDKSAFF